MELVYRMDPIDMIQELVMRVRSEDPVRGQWHVCSNQSGVVWCDSSNSVMGVSVEVQGIRVEDGA